MDVHLFWGLLRSNAEQQLAAWQRQQQQQQQQQQQPQPQPQPQPQQQPSVQEGVPPPAQPT